ncbi:MAG: MBL fold metallo-hydrolase [Vallitaleaceae bacterium]|nr:MBL fold metallo-hydrolase [Vallitaleaceae bacterium]
MEITYIDHSGFLLEWENCYWLFDYYKADIPVMKEHKKIIVFVSHKHKDHFNPKIFDLYNMYEDVEYVLSSDIEALQLKDQKMGINQKLWDKIIWVHPSQMYSLIIRDDSEIMIKTLVSTDEGVAFLLTYQEKTIYYAGDLNLWVWPGETEAYNTDMTLKFKTEMKALQDLHIDIAFAPLDPRQEKYYFLGVETLLNTAKVKYLFPMHFWDQPSIIQQYKKERASSIHNTKVMEVQQSGQKWNIKI